MTACVYYAKTDPALSRDGQREASRALLARALAAFGDDTPRELIKGLHGTKPVLSGTHAPSCNLTHTEGLVAVALMFANQGDIGIDAQAPKGTPSQALRRRVLCEAERQADVSDNAFWALWTLKEATMKTCGKGLAMGFHTVCFDAQAIECMNMHCVAGTPYMASGDEKIESDVKAGVMTFSKRQEADAMYGVSTECGISSGTSQKHNECSHPCRGRTPAGQAPVGLPQTNTAHGTPSVHSVQSDSYPVLAGSRSDEAIQRETVQPASSPYSFTLTRIGSIPLAVCASAWVDNITFFEA